MIKFVGKVHSTTINTSLGHHYISIILLHHYIYDIIIRWLKQTEKNQARINQSKNQSTKNYLHGSKNRKG